ncbi:hypothetical protein [Rahnella inusitata]|uniref:hypothetical protein n=1 Tax=Rahnella inusitata TaxID=58169 RepID=UPI001FD1E61D|nr:hypothetical protein [Rahnella inusitata]
MTEATSKPILDMCCGSRMFWLDKQDASVTCDYEDEDPVHERYALGEERRKESV